MPKLLYSDKCRFLSDHDFPMTSPGTGSVLFGNRAMLLPVSGETVLLRLVAEG